MTGAMRGIFVGGQSTSHALMKAVAVNKLTPVIDKTFDLMRRPKA
jgi:hypothetical protein